MNRQVVHLPFGLLFEKVASEPKSHIIPTYDESADLSYVEAENGQRIPYVEFMGAFGTDTFTLVRAEPTDTDPGDDQEFILSTNCLLATETFTKVAQEGTDTD